MSERLAKRLLIIGWDAADWLIIDTLFAAGAMPNLRKLVDQGVRANLASLEPRLSPLLWTSIATGKTADKHGILGFAEPDPSGNGMRLSSSTTRKTKALWNMLTQSGMRVNVVNWYASHPAEPINGINISNLLQEGMPKAVGEPWPMPAGTVHPSDEHDAFASLRMHVGSITGDMLQPLVPDLATTDPTDERPMILARHLAQTVSIHNALTSILAEDDQWDCTMAFFDAIDSVGHNFMQYHPPQMPHVGLRDFGLYMNVMYGLYQFHDMLLGVQLQLAGPDATVLLLSDHGFFSDHRRPVIQGLTDQQRLAAEPRWHRPLGVLALSGPGIRQNQRVYGASLLDIAPTALTILGLPVGSDMPGRVLTEAFDRAVTPDSIFSWEMKPGDAGMHPPERRLDPFEAHDSISQLVDLGYMSALPEDLQSQAEQARRESQCNLASVYASTGQSSLAIAAFSDLHAKYPNEPRFALGLARTLYVACEFNRCVDVLRHHQTLDPQNVHPRAMFAQALISSGREDEGLAALKELEREVLAHPDIAGPLGDAYLALAKWDDAYRHLATALKLDPESTAVHLKFARACVGRGEFELAVEHALQAIQIIHFLPDAHHTLGVALTWMKDYDRAIKAFEVALSMSPSLLETHRYLATIYRLRGDSMNAAKHRDIARHLMDAQAGGTIRSEFLRRETPLGPQEWSRKMGLDDVAD